MARDFHLSPVDVYDMDVDQWTVFKGAADALTKEREDAMVAAEKAERQARRGDA